MGMIIGDSEIAMKLARQLIRRNLIEYIEDGEDSFTKFKRENLHIVNAHDIPVAGREELLDLARNSLEVIVRAKRVAARNAANKARKEVLESLRRRTIQQEEEQ